MNRNVKILGEGLYSPILKDVAWLENAQLIFIITLNKVSVIFFRAAASI